MTCPLYVRKVSGLIYSPPAQDVVGNVFMHTYFSPAPIRTHGRHSCVSAPRFSTKTSLYIKRASRGSGSNSHNRLVVVVDVALIYEACTFRAFSFILCGTAPRTFLSPRELCECVFRGGLWRAVPMGFMHVWAPPNELTMIFCLA